MIETLRNAWKIEDLRRKIIYTLGIVLVFRIGSAIPVPYVNPALISAFLQQNTNTIFGYFDLLSGGAFATATIFALSVQPYINSSIIIQLLTVAIPALEKLSKEGEEGKKILTKITRYSAVAIGALLGYGYYTILNRSQAVTKEGFFPALVIVTTFVAGSMLIMWLAEQIDVKGIGNGVSIILFSGIIAKLPSGARALYQGFVEDKIGIISIIVILMVALLMVAFVVLMTNAERRIPVQYAKKVVGRKMYGGQSTHIPIKVNMTGVLPVIFASSIVSIPSTIAMFLPTPAEDSFWAKFLGLFDNTSPVYAALYLLLIVGFSYFYVAIQFNPVEMANNLKKNGGFIPGIRPGKPTSDFISKILSKITFMGALFLGVIAALPILSNGLFDVNISLGGTSIIIIVGVALETVRQMESMMLMRHYKGFLE